MRPISLLPLAILFACADERQFVTLAANLALPAGREVELRAPVPLRAPAEAKGRTAPGVGRAALTGILFVLKTGIPWEYLPAEMGCGSGMTCWRRLRDICISRQRRVPG